MLSCHFWRVDFSIQLIKWLFQKVLSEKTTLFVIDIQSSYKDLHCIKKSVFGVFWSAFFTDFLAFGLNLSVFSPNAGKSGKSLDQNNSEYGLFLRRVTIWQSFTIWKFLKLWLFDFFFYTFTRKSAFLLIIYFLVFHSDRDSIKKGYFEGKITLCLHFYIIL